MHRNAADLEYVCQYNHWLKSLNAAQRAQLDAAGVGAPSLPRLNAKLTDHEGQLVDGQHTEHPHAPTTSDAVYPDSEAPVEDRAFILASQCIREIAHRLESHSPLSYALCRALGLSRIHSRDAAKKFELSDQRIHQLYAEVRTIIDDLAGQPQLDNRPTPPRITPAYGPPTAGVWYDRAQAAQYLGLSPSKFREACEKHGCHPTPSGPRFYYDESSILSLDEKLQTKKTSSHGKKGKGLLSKPKESKGGVQDHHSNKPSFLKSSDTQQRPDTQPRKRNRLYADTRQQELPL